MAQKTNFEKQLNNDGTKNPKYVDLLEEDKPIAGQKFVCVSFVSPENILKQKEVFYFEQFLKHWDFSKSTQKFTQFLNFISFKHNLDFDAITEDFADFVKSEKFDLLDSSILDDYKTFKDIHEERLEGEFNKLVNFQTSTRGIKIRGVYPTQDEAELRCKLLREIDPYHDV